VIRRAFVLGVAALAATAGGATGADQATRALTLPGPVRELAADGARVAVDLETSSLKCTRDRVAVWGPLTRTLIPLGASPCRGSTRLGAGLFSVALAGARVAYVQYAGAKDRELEVRVASLARPRPATVASATFGTSIENASSIARVAGDGSLLAFDWWNVCSSCAGGNPTPERDALWRIVPTGSACPRAPGLGGLARCRMVISLGAPVRLLAADGGRGLLAYRLGLDNVAVVTAAGAPKYSGFFPGRVRAARLEDGVLVVFTREPAKNDLWVVDTKSSDVQRRGPWPLPSSRSTGDSVCTLSGCAAPAALRLEDYHGGIVVYTLGRDVHLLRLSDRRDVRIRAAGLAPAHAQLEAPGLFYSDRPATSPSRGRVTFLPMAAVLALFG
jgi:hypothetical protein